MSNYRQKAPFNDWWYWSDVLSKRLKLAADIYRDQDETARSNEVGGIAKKLHDLFIGPARLGQKQNKTDEEKADLMKAEEAAIFEAVGVWRDVLNNLPFISASMEDAFGCKWAEIDPTPKKKAATETGTGEEGDDGKSSGSSGGSSGGSSSGGGPRVKADPRALELFWGPKGRYDEGIRSGLPKDGGLPGILMNYLVLERSSSNRSPTQYKTENAHQQYWGRQQTLNTKPGGVGGGF